MGPRGLRAGVRIHYSFEFTIRGYGFFRYNLDFSWNYGWSYFGSHFSPILLTILPLYFLWPTPTTLLVVQTALLAFASIPLYSLSMKSSKSRVLSLFVACTYLLYYPLHQANWLDFHEVSFMPILYFSMIYFIRKGSAGGTLVTSLLFMSINEFMPLMVAFIGVVMLIDSRLKRCDAKSQAKLFFKLGVLLVVISILWYMVAISALTWVNPFWTTARFEHRFQRNLVTLLTNPAMLLENIPSIGEKIYYFFIILLPLLYIPLLSLRNLIPSIPFVALVLLTVYQQIWSPFQYYALYIVGPLFVACAASIVKIHQTYAKRLFLIILVLSIPLLGSVLLFSPLSPWKPKPVYSEHVKAIYEALETVQNDSTVFVQGDRFMYFYRSPKAYAILNDIRVPEGVTPDYLVFDTKSPFFYESVTPQIDDFVKRGYGLTVFSDGILIYRRGHADGLILEKPYKIGPADVRLKDGLGKVIVNENLLELRGNNSGWYGPYLTLPPGNYRAEFILGPAEGPQEDRVLRLDIASGAGEKVIAQTDVFRGDLRSDWNKVTLSFNLDKWQSQMEFRGYSETDDSVRLAGISIHAENR